jgi:hypothetical protein
MTTVAKKLQAVPALLAGVGFLTTSATLAAPPASVASARATHPLDLSLHDANDSSAIASRGAVAEGVSAADELARVRSSRSSPNPLEDSGARDQLPPLSLDAPRVESRLEELARRLHREGIPLAKLWQSHTALLSLGLNSRGKPGLWLIQKIP